MALKGGVGPPAQGVLASAETASLQVQLNNGRWFDHCQAAPPRDFIVARIARGSLVSTGSAAGGQRSLVLRGSGRALEALFPPRRNAYPGFDWATVFAGEAETTPLDQGHYEKTGSGRLKIDFQ